MESISPNPILEFNPNQIAEVRETLNYDDKNRLLQDINIFEDWIKMQQHFMVKDYDKEFLERYLISSKGSIERAKKLLDKMCTLRGLMPEYLQGFDIENEFQNHRNVFHTCVLPKPTIENYRILYFTINNPDASLFEHINLTRFLMMNFQYLYHYDYNAGVVMVVDTRKFTFGIIAKLSPIVIANTTMIMHEALGLRLRGLHLISGTKFMDTMVGIVKQGLSKKLTARLHVHDNFESLFKMIPKDLLPKDIGGDTDTIENLSEKSFKEFCSPTFMKQVKYMETATTDESKRLSSKFNEEYSGMPGSFKALTVD